MPRTVHGIEIQFNIIEDRGVREVVEYVPEGWGIIDTYHPTPSVTPWDYHGGKHQREYEAVLKAAGVLAICLETRRSRLNPMGSGPGGRVRFGDNMMPSTYSIAVPVADTEKAKEAIKAHKEAIDAWLFKGGAMPEACRQ